MQTSAVQSSLSGDELVLIQVEPRLAGSLHTTIINQAGPVLTQIEAGLVYCMPCKLKLRGNHEFGLGTFV